MATLIYSPNQEEAINLNNVDFISRDAEDKVIKFTRKQVSNRQVEWIRVGTWKYPTGDETETAYQQIISQFGTKIGS